MTDKKPAPRRPYSWECAWCKRQYVAPDRALRHGVRRLRVDPGAMDCGAAGGVGGATAAGSRSGVMGGAAPTVISEASRTRPSQSRAGSHYSLSL